MALAFLANLKDKVKIVAGIVIVILILKVLRTFIGKSSDEDEEFADFTEIFRRLIEESKKQSAIPLSKWQEQTMKGAIISDAVNSYNRLIGFIYKYPEDSGTIRLDIKNRFFEKSPSCYIRRDWATVLPSGMVIPRPADNKLEASGNYTKWVECLRDKSPQCQALLEDYRKRFLVEGCPKANLDYNPDNIQLRLVPDWFPRLK